MKRASGDSGAANAEGVLEAPTLREEGDPQQDMRSGWVAVLNRGATWVTDHELWLVAVVVCILVFPSLVPEPLIPLALLLIPTSWLCRRVAKGYLTVRTCLDGPVVALLAMIPVGLYASADPDLSFPIVHKMMAEVALFYGMVNSIRPLKQVRRFVAPLLGMSAGISVLGLLGTDWHPGKAGFLPPVFLQVYDHLPHVIIPPLNEAGFSPNIVGGTLAMLFPVTLAFFLRGSSRMVRSVLGLSLLVMGFTLLFTLSRGAWMGLVAALLCMAIWRSRWFLLAIPILMALTLLVVQRVGLEPVADFMLATHSTTSMASRAEVWQRAIYMIQDFPYTGIGLGTFSRVGPAMYPYFLAGWDADIPHAHNIFLQAGVDFGLPGLVAFTGVVAASAFMAWDAARLARQSDLEPLAIGLFCGFIAYLTHGLFDSITAVSIKAGVVLWAFLGFTAALWRSLKADPLT